MVADPPTLGAPLRIQVAERNGPSLFSALCEFTYLVTVGSVSNEDFLFLRGTLAVPLKVLFLLLIAEFE